MKWHKTELTKEELEDIELERQIEEEFKEEKFKLSDLFKHDEDDSEDLSLYFDDEELKEERKEEQRYLFTILGIAFSIVLVIFIAVLGILNFIK